MSAAGYGPYYRVSTRRQGQSDLGLEAQRAAVHAFAPLPSQLLAALHYPEFRQHQATLLTATLDRPRRNTGFILALRDSVLDFVCCARPAANTLTVGIFPLIAQHERETISKRTKDTLAAKKAKGRQWGATPD